jgi:uncharacterized protein (TIGR00645 family)
MSDEKSERLVASAAKRVEKGLESFLFNSRWLMAPFYLGLVVCLAVMLYKFLVIMVEFVGHLRSLTEADIILGAPSLIDVTLTGNLILIVVFSGYENFVSRIDPQGHPDWPEWMTKVDFSALKQKLLASIVAISAIQVLKAFLNIDASFSPERLGWLVGIHLVFVVSTLLLAFADRISDGNSSH